MSFFSFCLLAASAAIAESFIGYPAILYNKIRHPVTWMGFLLSALEMHFNKPSYSLFLRKTLGMVVLTIYLSICGVVAYIITKICFQIPFGFIILVIIASTLPAQRSLYMHVAAVASALEHQGITEARLKVSMIVGRKTEELDEAGVSRAAIESLSENFSDGIVAPLFWLATGGLMGAVVYKAANTADSMIGHKNERYSAFGWAAARFDDLINLPCSRLSALWLTLAAFFIPGASPKTACQAVKRDARHHRSPNAGWPEAAMAGALGFKLGGPRHYGTETVKDGYMGSGKYDLTYKDIRKSLRLFSIACLIQVIVLLGLSFSFFLISNK